MKSRAQTPDSQRGISSPVSFHPASTSGGAGGSGQVRWRRVCAGAALVFVAGVAAASARWLHLRAGEEARATEVATISSNDHEDALMVFATAPETTAPDIEIGSLDRAGKAASGRDHEPRLPPSAAAPDAVAPYPRATVLFESAAEARRVGNHGRAADFYLALFSHYGHSPEARAARAIFGRMLLDDGDADGALSQFAAYLRVGGALEEDALLGQALALERLGRTAEAMDTWSSLLRAFPESVHALRARDHMLALQKR